MKSFQIHITAQVIGIAIMDAGVAVKARMAARIQG